MPDKPLDMDRLQRRAREINADLKAEGRVRWFECAHGHWFAVVCDTMPTGRTITCPGCGTVTIRNA